MKLTILSQRAWIPVVLKWALIFQSGPFRGSSVVYYGIRWCADVDTQKWDQFALEFRGMKQYAFRDWLHTYVVSQVGMHMLHQSTK